MVDLGVQAPRVQAPRVQAPRVQACSMAGSGVIRAKSAFGRGCVKYRHGSWMQSEVVNCATVRQNNLMCGCSTIAESARTICAIDGTESMFLQCDCSCITNNSLSQPERSGTEPSLWLRAPWVGLAATCLQYISSAHVDRLVIRIHQIWGLAIVFETR